LVRWDYVLGVAGILPAIPSLLSPCSEVQFPSDQLCTSAFVQRQIPPEDEFRFAAYFAFSAITLQSASIAARRALVFRQTPPTCRTGAGRVKGRITTPRALP
jgi:hypothetical protein